MKRRNIILSIVSALVVLAGTSCSGVKNLQKPELELPAHIEGQTTDSLTLADVDWWKVYSDSALVYIISETLSHNRDLAAAGATMERLNELYGLTASNFFPTIGASAYANRETNKYYHENDIVDPEIGLNLTIRWEVDLWGGLRWARKKGEADFLASVENRRALRISLIAEAATAYFNLIALDNELSIVRRTLYTREENLKKAKLRFEGGLTPETVYRQAEVEYATTAALIPGLERRIEVQKNAITLLMGRFPAEELKRNNLMLEEPLPETIPVGLPSTLLQRRPDIRAAESSLRSALAGVGVAYADRFPNLRIGLTGGAEDNDFANLLRSPFSFVVGSITGTILDFGRNKRKYRAAISAYDQSRYKYEQTVLNAFREVDDAVVTFRNMRQTTARRRDLLEAARKYANLAYAQYNMGVLNYIDVLDAQRRYFDAQVGVSNAVRDEYLALVQLYKVLGGGWQDSAGR